MTTATAPQIAAPQIDWRTRTAPVEVADLTPAMLAPARKAADESRLPQTVWPSRFHGPDFFGIDCLLVSAAAVLDRRPVDTAPAAGHGLLTVLPTGWFGPTPTTHLEQGERA